MLISGSVREPSFTRNLTDAVEATIVTKGATTKHWDLRSAPLPIADPEHHRDPIKHPDFQVRELVETADAADAFVLASPIYHNSYSGVLKNALDHLSIAQFAYKPVGLISHGGYRSTQAVDQLRVVVRGLLGVATPTHICTKADDYQQTEDGKDGEAAIVKEILDRIDRFAKELVVFAQALKSLRDG